MSSLALIRWGALAAVLSGALWIVGELLYLIPSLRETNAPLAAPGAYFFQSLLFLVGGVLLLGGLLGLYAKHLGAWGTLGTAGFLVAFVGTALAVGSLWSNTIIIPAVVDLVPEEALETLPPIVLFGEITSWGLFTIGWLLLGVAILRAGLYPRLAAILLAVGAVIGFIPVPFALIPFAAAVAWLGLLSLRTGGGVSVEQPSRVR